MTLPRILLNKWNIDAKKQLGQHFLNDRSVAKNIAIISGVTADEVVLEIGAGLGALTIPLAGIAKKVYAVEKDSRLIPLLENEFIVNDLHNIIIVNKNILNVDINQLGETEGRKILVIGNLPYNISSQILVHLINSRKAISSAVLMFQAELARRITAEPNCKDYGRLTVMLRHCSEIKKILSLKGSSFFPSPKVDSEVIEVKFHHLVKNIVNDESFFFKLIKAAFGQRRKILKNALAGSELYIDKATAEQVLENSDIDPLKRAENLTVSDFARLSNNMEKALAGIS
ncbi:MAG TPA: ribosomal RNA small subunit methyltransferase A [Desulfobacteraceae bacterium]|nr:ribosomal RNA small subunit methyltransferase A [Desulfobacteraceae bacterium]